MKTLNLGLFKLALYFNKAMVGFTITTSKFELFSCFSKGLKGFWGLSGVTWKPERKLFTFGFGRFAAFVCSLRFKNT